MAYNCAIIDHDKSAVELLKNFVGSVQELRISGNCSTPAEALHLLSREKVDLMFVEIYMPELFGPELLHILSQPRGLILTTAYRDFAVEAFELDAIDYLVKPFSFERFLKAVNKFMMLKAASAITASIGVSFLFLRVDRKMIKIFLHEVLYIESLKDYVIIHLDGPKELKVKLSLYQIEEMLPPARFLRIHRSFIVSVEKITAFTRTDVEIGRKELPIGKSYAMAFQKLTPYFWSLPTGVPERPE